ncbi:metallophosphatase domain-containing protein [Bacteriovorax sp. Seq25_V]|uniref:metallophosphatase domain-containing protein n=1 Tax=Bacteriovorax sp. Seq25_V TaxID=1201288 RepID=UPI00038A53A7|nr:metallophosphatase domain-containing protein [Bacteriovorax sp. Seq25_V]EQC47561.1 calcineurin-like phosphoesterase family protein [Bacteriovorax sp. Seq25_V]
MKLTFFSDTHTKHSEVPIGSGDILFHCGDITRRGDLKELTDFASFMATLNFKHKIVIAGNHDFCFEDNRRDEAERILRDHGITYLNDSGIEINGLKIWGSPIQPEFFNWAFNRDRGEDIKKHWDLIPADTDILITHGPPYGISDLCAHGERVGCHDLLMRLSELRNLKIHAFGHIHEGYGLTSIDGVKYINACSLDEKYQYANGPITVVL